jgi:hypothetical protein
MRILTVAILLTWPALDACEAELTTTSGQLRVGVVQMALDQTIAENRDCIVSWIAKASTRGIASVCNMPERWNC